VQGLDNISATSALVSAQDCPVETRVLHEFDACMRASEKHAIVVSVKDETEARDLIRMAEAVAGGASRAVRPADLLGHPVHREPAPPGALRHGPGLRRWPRPASR
jgi:trimethylamine:corrinoid methyltransferase-like protein